MAALVRLGFSSQSLALLVVVFLAMKLAATLWTAHHYDRYQYDGAHHVWRARSGGLQLDVMAYNPPLYYLPALALGSDAEDGERMALLRYTNVLYLAVFYLLWLRVVFPRVLRDPRAVSVASLLLLALPGYQKLAAMVHPDNLLNVLAAASLATWLHLRARRSTARSDWGGLLALSVTIGATGLTRPFAAPVVAVMWVAALSYAATGRRVLGRAFVARALVVTAVVGSVSLSWYVARGVQTGTWGGGYDQHYIGQYAPYREGFDHTAYFSSFYLDELLRVPNRTVRELDPAGGQFHNRFGNSFFTLLYSETWGDHWLYFSSPTGGDDKVWYKRILFVLALPLIPLLGVRFFAGLGATAWELGRRPRRLRPEHAVVGMFLLGVGLYLYWQTGSGLTPGKNSSVKFIYNAYLYPLAIAIALRRGVGSSAHTAWVAYLIVLFVAALPVATYFPPE